MKFHFTLALTIMLGAKATAQENITYQKPPQEIMNLVDYDRAPSVSIDSKNEYMVLMYRPTYKTLNDLNQEELRLGGLRINPQHYISSTVTYNNKIAIQKVGAKQVVPVKGLPENARIAN